MEMIKRKGLMFVLSSPSGAGKSSLSRELIKRFNDDLILSVSATTRKKRHNEIDGIDYFFVNHDEFNQMVKSNNVLEYAKVFEEYYATPKDYVLNNLAKGIDVLFDIDWQGADSLVRQFPEDVVTIYILPPSLNELLNRLKTRASEDEEIINKRMSKAHSEISHWEGYDYIIVNDDFENSLTEISCILRSQRLKRERQIGMKGFVDSLLKEDL